MTTERQYPNALLRLLAELGALRLMLAAIAIVAIVFAPQPGVGVARDGIALVTTAVIPALGPVVFAVLLFDMLMSRVMMSDTQGERRAHYRRALMFDSVVAGALLLSWLPFLVYLLSL